MHVIFLFEGLGLGPFFGFLKVSTMIVDMAGAEGFHVHSALFSSACMFEGTMTRCGSFGACTGVGFGDGVAGKRSWEFL